MTSTSTADCAGPYAVTDAEWAVASTQFSRLNIYLAKSVCESLRVPVMNKDFRADVIQDLNIILLKIISRYKRQAYVVGCIEWFHKHPEMIPDSMLSEVGYGMFCWRFRSHLGANHGFHPEHDAILSEAMSKVTAPVDFRWERQGECAKFLRSVPAEKIDALSDVEREVFDRYLAAATSPAWTRPGPEDQVAMNDMSSKLSDLTTKPCKWRPFYMDQAFHPYVKRILVNGRNKIISRRPRVDGVGYVNIDDLAEAIPDARVCTTNQHVRRSDAAYHPRQADHDTFGYESRAAVDDYDDDVEEDSSVEVEAASCKTY